ncbi:MAG: hypothetical protein ABIP41_01630, partial [Croceibacterium sp.]
MTGHGITRLALAAAALVAAMPALAESADYYRGGWRAETTGGGIYEFVIRGNQVSGIYCTRCADGTTLARIVGTFDEAKGLSFTVRHLNLDGSLANEDRASARLRDGKLEITGKRGGTAFRQVALKDPRGPTPGGYPQTMLPPGSPPVAVIPASGGGGAGRPAPYVQPAPWRRLA